MSEPTVRTATCACGAASLDLTGEPLLVSACCCTRCQRRTGSFFGVTVYFHPDQLTARRGPETIFRRGGETGGVAFHFCPGCGATLWWEPEPAEGVIGVAGGAFADPSLPAPTRMVWTEKRHPFVRCPSGVAQFRQGPG